MSLGVCGKVTLFLPDKFSFFSQAINKEEVIIHTARHTFATTTTLAKGVPIETVSKMLGHTNIETTQIYARITNNKIGNDMQGLDKKFIGIEKIYKEAM